MCWVFFVNRQTENPLKLTGAGLSRLWSVGVFSFSELSFGNLPACIQEKNCKFLLFFFCKLNIFSYCTPACIVCVWGLFFFKHLNILL